MTLKAETCQLTLDSHVLNFSPGRNGAPKPRINRLPDLLQIKVSFSSPMKILMEACISALNFCLKFTSLETTYIRGKYNEPLFENFTYNYLAWIGFPLPHVWIYRPRHRYMFYIC